MESNIVEPLDRLDLDTVDGRIDASRKLTSALSEAQFMEVMARWESKFTPEYMDELTRKCYEDDRSYPENFSNWYPHIKDLGYFKSADIISNQIFTLDEIKIMQETDDYSKVNWDKINEILKPTLDKMENYRVYNIKNGCFSNKFNFETCLATKQTLAEQLWKINYESTSLDTGGYTELVVRELIPFNRSETPTIYNGMPMREEIRVFYNMDRNIVEYVEDYWKYKYCRPHIYNKTDQIIFDWFHNKVKTRKTQHRERIRELENIIRDNIHTLKFDGELKGVWSIDFMYVDDDSNYSGIWLIDMARGFRSAYWNMDKLTYKTQLELKKNIKR